MSLPREYLDLSAFLRRVAVRLRQCETPADTLSLNPADQPYSNEELAAKLERVAEDREDEALLALKMVRSGAALTPQQMVDTALQLASVETNADVSCNPAFIVGLAQIAQAAIEAHQASWRVA